ncbi:PriCT-2 domain-containing protein [Nitrosomonas sp. ANs5]|uniref:PriCT-2 domain-containing protein n=1 Tax=Nitrosomonas sp. ANs5 TaxID=3423941 RepID=UPI003D329439
MLHYTTCHEAAHHYLDFGLKVIPIHPAEKKTAVYWNEWLSNLSHESIDEHWEVHPSHELGAIVDSGLFIVDADAPESLAHLLEIEKALGVTPNMTHKTSKGEHHFFRRAAGTYAVVKSYSTAARPEALDIRTGRSDTEGRSMIILPPSSGKEVLLAEADSVGELVEVNQEFIDAIFKHNGEQPPRPFETKAADQIRKEASQSEAAEIVSYITPDLGYNDWLKVLMGLHHEFQGSEVGLAIADQWSSQGKSYPGTEEIEYKWRSFTVDASSPTTFKSICRLAELAGANLSEIARKHKGIKFESVADDFEEVEDEQETIAPTIILPGALGMLQKFIYGAMIYPDMDVAAITAMAAMSSYTQNRFTVKSLFGPLTLNEYYILMAGTTFGKESLRKALESLNNELRKQLYKGYADSAGTPTPVLGTSVHCSLPASKQGLHQFLEENRSLFFMSDEFAEWLAQATTGGNPYRQECVGHLMEAYTRGNGTLSAPKSVTTKYDPVNSPRVTIFATTTGERLAEALTLSQAESGTYNRMVMFVAKRKVSKRYEGFNLEPSQELIDFFSWMQTLTEADSEICLDDEAREFYKHHDATVMEPIKSKDNLLGGRLSEQALKLAGMLALSDKVTLISKKHLKLAYEIRTAIYNDTKLHLDSNGALSDEDVTVKAFNQIKNAVAKKGSLPLAHLVNHSRAYKNLTQFQRDKTLESLVKYEYIKFVQNPKGGKRIFYIGDF